MTAQGSLIVRTGLSGTFGCPKCPKWGASARALAADSHATSAARTVALAERTGGGRTDAFLCELVGASVFATGRHSDRGRRGGGSAQHQHRWRAARFSDERRQRRYQRRSLGLIE